MSIYTKKGDAGETSLYGGTRLPKSSLRVDAYGTVDEANAILGAVYAGLEFDDLKQIIREMQRNMFVVGAQLASDREGEKKLTRLIGEEDILGLESVIDFYTKEFGGFSGFTIPGGTQTSALIHMARTVVRRSERVAVALSAEEFVSPLLLKYLNRMSDTLFVLSRAEIQKTFIKKVAERIFELSVFSEKNLYDKMLEAAVAESKRLNVPVCIAITDAAGYLLNFYRMEGAILASISIAQNKAYTSAQMKCETGELAALAKPEGPLYGLNTADSRLIVFAGGLPLVKDGQVVGAVGISGGSVEEDEQIGRKAVEVFNEYISGQR